MASNVFFAVNCNSSSHHPGTQGGVLHGQSGSSCSETMSTSADKSCSTSFDSNESILSPEESSILTSPPSGGEEGMGGGAASTPADSLSQSSLVLKSPVSTTSRTPPSPSISGMTPLKQVRQDLGWIPIFITDLPNNRIGQLLSSHHDFYYITVHIYNLELVVTGQDSSRISISRPILH